MTTHYYVDRDFGDETEPVICTFDPMGHGNLGMFHCPECGEMQLGGVPHLAPEDWFWDGLVLIEVDSSPPI